MAEKTATVNGTKFVYVTYIRTTQQKLWDALLTPEFNKQFWGGCWQESEWKKGSQWKLFFPDGRLGDSGEVLEIDPPHKLVLRWQHQVRPELKAEGDAIATLEIEPHGPIMKLTVTHTINRDNSKFIEAVSGGWPKILSSLQSFLETGQAHPIERCSESN